MPEFVSAGGYMEKSGWVGSPGVCSRSHILVPSLQSAVLFGSVSPVDCSPGQERL